MKIKDVLVTRTLAVALAIFSSTAAMGQQDTVATAPIEVPQSSPTLLRKVVGEKAPNWLKDVSDRIQLHGLCPRRLQLHATEQHQHELI